MTGNDPFPPPRDLPPGREKQRKEHLLAEISRGKRRFVGLPLARRRVSVFALAGALVAAAGLGLIVGAVINSPAGSGRASGTTTVKTTTLRHLPSVSGANYDWAVLYSNVAQLTRAAEIVVRGRVTDVSYLDETLDSALSTYTKVTLEVTESLKGGVAKGAALTFIEIGGMTTQAAIDESRGTASNRSDKNTKVQVLFEGAPLPKVGEDVVYFAKRDVIGQIRGSYFAPLGAFQGKFTITGGVAMRYVPDSIASNTFGPLRMPVAELEKRVRAALPLSRAQVSLPGHHPPPRWLWNLAQRESASLGDEHPRSLEFRLGLGRDATIILSGHFVCGSSCPFRPHGTAFVKGTRAEITVNKHTREPFAIRLE